MILVYTSGGYYRWCSSFHLCTFTSKWSETEKPNESWVSKLQLLALATVQKQYARASRELTSLHSYIINVYLDWLNAYLMRKPAAHSLPVEINRSNMSTSWFSRNTTETGSATWWRFTLRRRFASTSWIVNVEQQRPLQAAAENTNKQYKRMFP